MDTINTLSSDMEKLTKTIYDQTSTPDENGNIPEEQKDFPFTMPSDVYLGMDIIEHAKNYYDLHGGRELSAKPEEERRKALVDCRSTRSASRRIC